MKETGNKFGGQGLLDTVMLNCNQATRRLIMSEWDNIKKDHKSNKALKKARIEWVMECWFSFNQPGVSLIVRNLKTGTYWLTESDEEDIETENSTAFADWTGRI